ncbi:MAG TPA: hypothetical protein VGR81_14475 [Candidatus Acidoferrales bacterium]|nr:hypothetical protein [Candidatus Acidoferrales bacterium]
MAEVLPSGLEEEIYCLLLVYDGIFAIRITQEVRFDLVYWT